MISIYKLIHPDNAKVFYVGQTKHPSLRLKAHCRRMEEEGITPLMVIIEEVTDVCARSREKFWIKELFKEGHALENKTFVDIKYPPEVIWLKGMMDLVHLSKVAKAMGMPPKVLHNFCSGVHSLNEKWWPIVGQWVKDFTRSLRAKTM